MPTSMWAASPATLPVPLPAATTAVRSPANGYVAGIVESDHQGRHRLPTNTGSITRCRQLCGGCRGLCLQRVRFCQNCYNQGLCGTPAAVGAVVGMTNNASAAMSNLYYLDFTCAQGIGSAKSTSQTATAKTRAEMDSADFVNHEYGYGGYA